MVTLVLSRLAAMVPLLLVTSALIFVLAHLAPVDPAALILGTGASDEEVAAYARRLGLDRPLFEQYLNWLWSAVQGDLGESYFRSRPVTELIAMRVGVTVSLSVAGALVAIGVGVPTGVVAAKRPGSLVDRIVSGGVAIAIGVPGFWLALMLALVFAVHLRWFPAIGYTPLLESPALWAWSLVLPGLALGTHGAAVIARQTREAMIGAMSSPYVTALRSRGIGERRILGRYGLKNAMVPILAIIGVEIPVIVGGSLVVEQVFAQPGLGGLLVEGVLKGDFPLLEGGVMVIVLFVLLLNLGIDIAYGLVNPRVRPS